MRVVSLKLSDGLNTKIERVARARKQTKSDLVRDALEQFLDDPRQASAITVGDLAGDLLGTAEGPTDLTTNPKYMEKYGR